MPSGSPQPCDGIQVSASSSVKDIKLHAKMSCEANVRLGPPKWPSSVNRIGARLLREKGERLSSQNAVAGVTESLKVTRKVWFPASMNTFPVFQSTPIDGSPAPSSPALLHPRQG